ncbi:hypothetical protein M8C21_002167 [Ambrosia artemisiifolia]|uniref:Uncharacterized protein n=1 Tax=Ambrosia artemisiifolia TaxID=4212 RepID=A0AAD5GX96_AMBAR|nr:hypothetical protein M8C21_002167 [Ambrosia artemisiifolia]
MCGLVQCIWVGKIPYHRQRRVGVYHRNFEFVLYHHRLPISIIIATLVKSSIGLNSGWFWNTYKKIDPKGRGFGFT